MEALKNPAYAKAPHTPHRYLRRVFRPNSPPFARTSDLIGCPAPAGWCKKKRLTLPLPCYILKNA